MLAISKGTVQSVGVSSGILLCSHHHRASSELTLSVFFKIFFFFLHRPFLKSLSNLLNFFLCFRFWFVGHEARGILALRRGFEPVPVASEGKVLTTGLLRKS